MTIRADTKKPMLTQIAEGGFDHIDPAFSNQPFTSEVRKNSKPNWILYMPGLRTDSFFPNQGERVKLSYSEFAYPATLEELLAYLRIENAGNWPKPILALGSRSHDQLLVPVYMPQEKSLVVRAVSTGLQANDSLLCVK